MYLIGFVTDEEHTALREAGYDVALYSCRKRLMSGWDDRGHAVQIFLDADPMDLLDLEKENDTD